MKTHTGRSTAIRTIERTALAALVLVTALVLAASPARAASTTVVLSQVYGGGGGSGYYLYDYVELFNLSSASVDVGGWSVQYGSSTGNFASTATNLYVIPAGTSIAAGKYLLIQLGGVGTGGVALPVTPDLVTGNLSMSQSSGKVALANISTALGCGATATLCTLPDVRIVDLVSYGAGNNAEGGASVNNGTALTNQQGGVRKLAGCQDTDNNNADFDVLAGAALVPRNGTTPAHSCVPGDAAPEVSSTTPTNGATGVALASNIDITFSEPVNVAGTWFTISCASSGAHTATVTGGPTTFTLDPDSDFVNGETCTVTVEADLVTDQDTNDPPDNMAADYAFSFTTVAIVPALSIDDVTVTEGNSGTVIASFTVSSVPAPTGTVTFDYATADGTTNPATAGTDYVAIPTTGGSIDAANPTLTISVTVNGDTGIEPNETFFVNLSNPAGGTIADGQGLGTITNDDFTPIHDIQGPGLTSPLSGSVTTQGIVTAIKSNGFFIQAPEAEYDADPDTSEGILVFTSSAPPAAVVLGARVQVVGTISDYVPAADPLQAPVTELTGPVVTQLSTSNALPAPIVLTAADTPPGAALEVLERYEGMRVTAASFTVVEGNLGNINETNATSTARNYFWATITGVARPFRETGIEQPEPVLTCQAGAGCVIPVFDSNAEVFEITSTGQTGATLIDTSAGATITGLVGPLDYTFRFWTIYPDPSPAPVVSGGAVPTTVSTPTDLEFTVGSWNLQRFFDTVNDPALSEPVLTATAFANRLDKASMAIRNSLVFPDILGVAEVENASTLLALATKINNDAVAASQPNPSYVAYLAEGNDPGGIDVGFLVKTALVDGVNPRIDGVSVTQEGLTTTYVNPVNNTAELLNDRPPLRLTATVRHAGGATFPVTVIMNHLRSLSGVNDETPPVPPALATEGARVRAKRKAQAEFLAGLVQAHIGENLVVMGDFNAYELNDGYVDVMGTVEGAPTPDTQVVAASPDLVNPNLVNLTEAVAAPQRYSYLYNGDAQAIDHMLVSGALVSATSAQRLEHARICADFNDTARNSAATPFRLSDHDPLVGFFQVPSFPAELVTFDAE